MKQEARKWVNNVCPGPIKKIDEFSFDINEKWRPLIWSELRGDVLYMQTLGVIWDPLCPCPSNQNLHTLGSNYIHLHKDKFLATYESNILPVNDNNMWEPTPYTKPLPPIERRMPGRPCMKRKRHVSEHQDRFS
uniref:Uncharacterized protein n=1 Tax=Lactuca sativa TaxID=4236 RepID=A0A9R1VIV6_LACSA|nr:hypothetical protein LSAT_V11C500298430 [Lactuca sativa]